MRRCSRQSSVESRDIAYLTIRATATMQHPCKPKGNAWCCGCLRALAVLVMDFIRIDAEEEVLPKSFVVPGGKLCWVRCGGWGFSEENLAGPAPASVARSRPRELIPGRLAPEGDRGQTQPMRSNPCLRSSTVQRKASISASGYRHRHTGVPWENSPVQGRYDANCALLLDCACPLRAKPECATHQMGGGPDSYPGVAASRIESESLEHL